MTETVEKNVSNFIQPYGDRTKLLSLLSDAEKHKILVEFNAGKTDYPNDKTIQRLFREQVEQTPDNIAAAGPWQSKNRTDTTDMTHISYRQLNEKADQLSGVLIEKGVRPDTIVGIMVERTLEMIIAVLGILKAGGAYLPIAPDCPEDRINYMLADSNAKILVTIPGLSGKFKKLSIVNCQLLMVNENPPNRRRLNNPPKEANSINNLQLKDNNLIYIIYTSGSTGDPKGAALEHAGMMNHLQAMIHDFPITEKSIIAQNAPYTFDISVWQFLAPLAVGGKTIIYPHELILEPDLFIAQLVNHQVTILEVVPSYLTIILNLLEERCTVPLPFAFLMVTGEEVKPQLVKRWFEKYPGITMVNAYGPTEAADDITLYMIDKAPESDRESVSIGKPLKNLQIYIVDENMKLCPIGVKGEICVSGVGVGRGYLNNVERTNRAFTANPFVKKKGARLYKTGDLGCWRPDGTLDFFGRKDFQLKIRGFRIELGEIENKLFHHPQVKEAVVTAGGEEEESKYICAYIVGEKGHDITAIKEYLSTKLPAYMVPSQFIQLDRLPLTPNGKVDRKALPHPHGTTQTGTEYLAPSTEMEIKLANIWQEVLGIEKIGINDNFFESGGHSLKAMQVISKLQNKNIDIRINDIFMHQTVKELANYISTFETNEDSMTISEAERVLKREYREDAVFIRYHVEQAVYTVLYVEDSLWCRRDEIIEFINGRLPGRQHPHYMRPLSLLPAESAKNPRMTPDQFAHRLQLEKVDADALLPGIFAEMEKAWQLYNQTIVNNQITAKYKLSPVQQGHLTIAKRTTGTMMVFDNSPDRGILEKALLLLIKRQGLLRSKLAKENETLVWQEYEAPVSERLPIPYVDVSAYDITGQKQILAKIHAKEFARTFNPEDSLLYRLVLIKENLKDFLLFIPVDHIIFDGMSDEVVKRNLLDYYRALKKGIEIPPDKTIPYALYIEQIGKGPQDITREELVKMYDLENYAIYKRKVEAVIKKGKKETGNRVSDMLLYEIKFEPDANTGETVSISEDKAWETAFILFTVMLKRYFNLHRVPIELISYGRRYQDKSFFDTVGEFLDFIPVLVPADEQNPGTMVEYTRERVTAASKHGINFISLLHNPVLKEKWGEDVNVMAIGRSELSNLQVLFNFEGKYSEKERHLFKRVSPGKSRKKPARDSGRWIRTEAFYTSTSISLRIRSTIEPDMSKFKKILDEVKEQVCFGGGSGDLKIGK